MLTTIVFQVFSTWSRPRLHQIGDFNNLNQLTEQANP